MDTLNGYLKENYHKSSLDEMEKDGEMSVLHLHGNRIVSGRIKTNEKYGIRFLPENGEEEEIPKITIKFLYHKQYEAALKKKIKTDLAVKEKRLEPIVKPGGRNHIKNKTLFPLMKEKALLFFTTLEGDVLGGVVGGFSRYEILIFGKQRIPITLLRHAVYDLRDKRNKCYLKSAVKKRTQTHRLRESA